ncbi:GNAT family N-acetyltransferase [Irregularibacter muris]|uniref:GNAT family N-acetyltransferase n=1 Tax=Irregularibacter muris TaxID=1796619 RepID=A0AAE3HFZ6_9FIRM|nr:GNAT family N-acetyltransferase [Irregularibacter muris]MCR1898734.1 GNAT family N-acetyltransferase [Irregularibacter muris]
MLHTIEKGILKKKERDTFKEVEYFMRDLNQKDIDKIMELKDFVVKNIENSEVFASSSREILLQEVLKSNKGLALGIFVKDELVAYRSVKFPGDAAYNIGREISLPENELGKVIYLQATVVHPDYRGNGIQKKTLEYIFNLAREKRLWHILSTISPYNYHSLKNTLDYQLRIKELKARSGGYGGSLRYILHRDLRENQEKVYQEIIAIDHKDIKEQSNLLKRGYEGFAIEKDQDSYKISYGSR